jgi:WD40 repeat protein
LLSGSEDKTIRLWDLVTGKPMQVFEGHTSEVTGVAFSVDGRKVLSGSADKTARLWALSK